MADNNFLPLESTGGTLPHAESGASNQFQPLTSSGYEINHASQVNALLPALEGSTQTMAADNIATQAATLPALTGTGTWGWRFKGKFKFLIFTGHADVPAVARQAAMLPALTGSGDMLVGNMAEGSGSFPMLVAGDAWTGATGAALLPALEGFATTLAFDEARHIARFPSLKGFGSASLYSYAASGFGVFPALRAANVLARGLMLLPRLHGLGRMTNAATFVTVAYAYNLHRNAMTTFANFPFRAFVRFQNQYYGVGFNGGLYRLAGDFDDKTLSGAANDTPINWSFETGYDDADSPALKGIPAVYIDGVIEKGAELTIVTDKRARYTYTLDSGSGVADYRTHRVPTGRGLRSRNIGVAMSNMQGGFAEIDQLAPHYVISPRSI